MAIRKINGRLFRVNGQNNTGMRKYAGWSVERTEAEIAQMDALAHKAVKPAIPGGKVAVRRGGAFVGFTGGK